MTVQRSSALRQRFDPRLSARLRLTIAFALLVSVVGGSIVTSIYLVMRFFPQYRIVSSTALEAVIRKTSESPLELRAPRADAVPGMRLTKTSGDSGVATLSSESDILRLLLLTSLIVFAVVLVGGVFLSWLVAGRVLRPVEEITIAARRAATGRLDHRLDHTGPPDEFGRLAATFDDMLERLQRSFEAQRRFASNASHELRTPLATTQAMLDVALLDPDGFDRETLARRLRETNARNIETVEALLTLSDAQAGTTATDAIALDEVTREVIAGMLAIAAERDVTLHSSILAAQVTGDPTLVRLLVSNLVGNAVRYNRIAGDVWITVVGTTLRVENTGAVIADDDLLRLTEPFFRAAGRVAGSHGLGLALVHAIAQGHGAGLELENRPDGGLVVIVSFAEQT